MAVAKPGELREGISGNKFLQNLWELPEAQTARGGLRGGAERLSGNDLVLGYP